MEELLKHLTEVSIRQQQIMEHMASRQGDAERELAALRTAAHRTPLPDPRVQAVQLMPRMTAHDDVEMYMQMFEATAIREAWPEDEWARLLAPLLTGEAQRAYFTMTAERSRDYEEVKKEILSRVGLSPICAAQQFHDWAYRARQPARAQAAELTRFAHHWLLTGGPSAHKVAERVVIDRLLRALPRALRQAAGMRNPTDLDELVEVIELAEAAQHREVGERAPPFPRRVVQERRSPGGHPATREQACGSRPPGTNRCPPSRRAPQGRIWLAGCSVHNPPPEAPRAEVHINGRPFIALLDSGSGVSLIQPTVLPPRTGSRARLAITCVHGDTRHVPARRVTITATPGSWPVEVGILKDLPVPVLLGRDWPGFDQLLTSSTQPASLAGDRRRRRSARRPRRRPALLTSDSPRGGESPSQNSNLFFDVFQQIAGGGTLANEQRGDERLKHCWSQVRVAEGEDLQPAPHPTPHFVIQNGLLLLCRAAKGEGKDVAGGTAKQSPDGVGTRSCPPDGWPPRRSKHRATDPGSLPLARTGGGCQAVLPSLPDVPTDIATYSSPPAR
uniref:SCAN box domain-containing protein n=1 Tax=Cyprinus carpio carpio TaxID=630221 RepID=A0A9J8DEU1_CYPCA